MNITRHDTNNGYGHRTDNLATLYTQWSTPWLIPTNPRHARTVDGGVADDYATNGATIVDGNGSVWVFDTVAHRWVALTR